MAHGQEGIGQLQHPVALPCRGRAGEPLHIALDLPRHLRVGRGVWPVQIGAVEGKAVEVLIEGHGRPEDAVVGGH
jgi:hypothetical protein